VGQPGELQRQLDPASGLGSANAAQLHPGADLSVVNLVHDIRQALEQ
jgi:hypothetical protein